MTTSTTEISLTKDQQEALEAFYKFLTDPIETVFVLSGYSGCGKSTLVRTIVDRTPNFIKTAKLIYPKQKEYTTVLTATTNKAAENLSQITGEAVGTIHSFLGLRVQTDYRTNVTKLIPKNAEVKEGYLLFIDEASFVDKDLLKIIFQKTANSKIIFIGDPAQLTPVKSHGAPVFDANFSGAALTTVVRQAEGNPIVDLSTKFRNTVNTGEFFSFKPDGNAIKHMTREQFNQAIEQEFTRPGWHYSDSKILGWTNKCVIGYNQFVRNHVKGDPEFQEGDYAICNSFLSLNKISIKTDQMVMITTIEPETVRHGVRGNMFTVDYTTRVFQPKSLAEKNAAIKKLREKGDFQTVTEIETQWIDLRAAYACTINKAQGSTFDKVFVDLDDISRCNSGDQVARMLYVGVSRARTQVFLTGDLI